MRRRCGCIAGNGGEEGRGNLRGLRGGAAARLFFLIGCGAAWPIDVASARAASMARSCDAD
eukprot:2343746-Pyramimonas_sp.AAC.1